MKKYILIGILGLISVALKAQNAFNYQELGIGLNASYVRGYTNVTRQYNHPAFDIAILYNYNPYLPIAVEFQKGTLSGGGLTVKLDKYGRQYSNNYSAISLHADIQLGAGIDYEDNNFLKFVKNFYIGTGIGILSNDNTVQRTNVIVANGPLNYVFPGTDKGTNIVLPIRFGYEIKIFDSYREPTMAIGIGYVHNMTFGEGLDGYNDPNAKFKNNALDQYRQIVVGFKYFFGNVVSYNKPLRKYR
ncbi:MAG: hypothetical protein M3N14_12070 [Bacteroidota bacterium]|nr:hypothetical protein [Bacteroidota bacterium]